MVIDVSATGSQGGTVAIGPGGGNVMYTPAPNFFGTETFTYRVADGDGGEATGTVTMTVTDVADPALAVNDTFTVAENAAEANLDVLDNDNDANPDAPEIYTITAVTQPANGTVEIADDDSSVLYQPNAGFVGTDTFTYTIMDDDGTSSTATVTVTVTDVNQPPVAVDDVVNGVLEDQTTPTEIDVLANDTTNEIGETLEIESFTQPAASMGTVAESIDGTKLLFTPAPNFNGQATFTYVVSDGRGGTDTGMVTVNVTPVNDPPDAVDDVRTVAEDSGPLEIDVLANDIGGDVQLMNVTITTTQPGSGTVALTPDNRRVIFTPAPNFNGTATFEYTINGGAGLTDTAIVTITVTPVDDPPVAAADTFTINEDAVTEFDILANDIAQNPDTGETLTIAAVGLKGPPSQPGVTARGGTVELINNGTRVRYTPPSNNVTQDSFDYIVTEGNLTSEGVVTINFTALNDPPLAVADTAEAEVDSDLPDNIIDVLINDIAQNPDAGETLTVIGASDFSDGGTFDIVDNKIRYKPAAGFVGNETFKYVVRDQAGLESEGSVTVEVGDLADDDTFTITEDPTSPQELNVLANDRPVRRSRLTPLRDSMPPRAPRRSAPIGKESSSHPPPIEIPP